MKYVSCILKMKKWRSHGKGEQSHTSLPGPGLSAPKLLRNPQRGTETDSRRAVSRRECLAGAWASSRSRRGGPSVCRRGRVTQHHLRCDRGPDSGLGGAMLQGGTPTAPPRRKSARSQTWHCQASGTVTSLCGTSPCQPDATAAGTLNRGGVGTPQKEEGEPTPGASL